jgi:hypothetical protein
MALAGEIFEELAADFVTLHEVLPKNPEQQTDRIYKINRINARQEISRLLLFVDASM